MADIKTVQDLRVECFMIAQAGGNFTNIKVSVAGEVYGIKMIFMNDETGELHILTDDKR